MTSIAIAGAGVVGASIALNLALRGARNVILVDPFGVASGASGKALGGIRQQFSTAPEVALAKASLSFFEELGPRFFRPVGYLFLTKTPIGEASLTERWHLQKDLGVEAMILDPLDLRRRFPYLNMEGVHLGLFGPRDGTADTVAVNHEIVRRAIEAGVELREGVDIREIEADVTVFACGARTPELVAPYGVTLPVKPLCRQLTETEAIEGLPYDLPLTIDAETGFHFRRKRDRLVLAMRDDAHRWGFDEIVDESAVPERMRRLRTLIPAARETRAAGTWAGLYDMTPDGHPIIGAIDADVYVACGFSGHGFMQSPAVGRAVAELVLDGKSDFDLSAFRPDRFTGASEIPESLIL